MKKRKWLIIGVLLAVVAAAAIGGGLVYAQTKTQPSNTPGKSLADRVAAILGIDQTKVENAFTQARKDMQDEALTNWLNKQVQAGKMTQAQADQYKQWWQSRPSNVPGIAPFGGGGHRFFGGFKGMPRMGGTPNATPSPTPKTN